MGLLGECFHFPLEKGNNNPQLQSLGRGRALIISD